LVLRKGFSHLFRIEGLAEAQPMMLEMVARREKPEQFLTNMADKIQAGLVRLA
jgi:hypothetical protein